MRWILLVFIAGALLASEERAYEAYQRGLAANTLEGKEEAFNKALTLYLDLKPDPYGNGKLDVNIGNCYFQLNAFPYALLYYLRAKRLRPQDPNIWHNTALTREKLGISAPPKQWSCILLLSTTLPLPLKIQILSWTILLFFIFCSLTLWFKRSWQLYLSMFFGIAAFLLLCNLAIARYLIPLDGLLLRASSLHQGAGEHDARILKNPLPAGSKVEVIRKKKDWLKVRTQNGDIGYVLDKEISLIS